MNLLETELIQVRYFRILSLRRLAKYAFLMKRVREEQKSNVSESVLC